MVCFVRRRRGEGAADHPQIGDHDSIVERFRLAGRCKVKPVIEISPALRVNEYSTFFTIQHLLHCFSYMGPRSKAALIHSEHCCRHLPQSNTPLVRRNDESNVLFIEISLSTSKIGFHPEPNRFKLSISHSRALNLG